MTTTTTTPVPSLTELGIGVTPSAGTLGAEITGLRLNELDDAGFAAIQRLLDEYLVLFFPEQHLTPHEHRAFAARFGEMEIHPFIPKLDDVEFPEIVQLRSSAGSIADVWHTDVTFSASPPICSVLHMAQLPERGGDTMWNNLYAVYEALSAPMRDMLQHLTAVHHALPFGRTDIQAVHPVVRKHPNTGRPLLFVNRQFTSHIVELSRGESRALLEYLYTFAEQPHFTCRRRWSQGDIGVWDNRCTQHYAVNDAVGERVIHRVTILGDHPEPAFDTDRWPAHQPHGMSAAVATERATH